MIGTGAGAAMQKVLEYEQHAAECRQMVAQMKNPKLKKRLEDMADVWDRLAQERYFSGRAALSLQINPVGSNVVSIGAEQIFEKADSIVHRFRLLSNQIHCAGASFRIGARTPKGGKSINAKCETVQKSSRQIPQIALI
jgi:hypothetical protein